MKNLILQPFGVGDVIFTQHLIKTICTGRIIWPVFPQFLEGLKRAYHGIDWVDANSEYGSYQTLRADIVMDGMRIIPIRHANTIMQVPYRDCMRSKYDMYDENWQNWRRTGYFRSTVQEKALFAQLGLREGQEYRLINRRFRSDESGIVEIPDNPDMANIRMERYKGYSLFDWSLVIERATEIHTPGTALNYIIEILDLTAKEVHCYRRLPDEDHFHNYDSILQKHKYIFH